MKTWISSLCGSLLALVLSSGHGEQVKVPPLIRIVVPTQPGAANDLTARTIAPLLAARLGATVIVENRAGASGLLGAATVAKGPTDGSMILFLSSTLVSAGATMRTPPVDVIKDLTPVAAIAEFPLVFTVPANSRIHSPADLVATARAKPGVLTHGSGGVGTIGHIAQEMFDDAAKVQIRHIPYKGNSGAVLDMLSGNIDMVIANYSSLSAHLKSGRARAIGVTTRQPAAAFPGLPTMNTVAPGYEATFWAGAWVAAGTPSAIVHRYNRELVEIAKGKELAGQLQLDGAVPLNWTPEQFAARIRSDYTAYKKLATEKNMIVD